MCFLCLSEGRAAWAVDSPAPPSPVATAPASTESAFSYPPPEVDALLSGLFAPGWNGRAVGTPTVVTVAFAEDGLDAARSGAAARLAPGTWSPFAESQRASARLALGQWAATSGLALIEVPDTPGGAGVDIRLRLEALPGTSIGQAAYPTLGHVALGLSRFGNDPLDPGGLGYLVLLHELGHALGFKHPFEGFPRLPAALDRADQTVMSYNLPPGSGPGGPLPAAPGPLDAAAARWVYGTQEAEDALGVGRAYDPAARAVLHVGTARPDAVLGTDHRDLIVLGLGNDTANARAGDDRLDGGPGSDALRGGPDSVFDGLTDRDTLLGGEGDDTLEGRAGDDRLDGGGGADLLFGDAPWGVGFGGSGHDRLAGGPGNDTLVGGRGLDTVYFDTGRRLVLLGDVVNGQTFADGRNVPTRGGTATTGPGDTDTFAEVEAFAFLDGRLAFDASDPHAYALRLHRAALGRAPDPLARDDLGDAIAAGLPTPRAAEALLAAPEFAARSPAAASGDPWALVAALYRNALGREPDPGGHAFWVSGLVSGRLPSRGDLVLAFADDRASLLATAPAVGAGLWDADDASASLARLYGTVLGRLPDLPGLHAWRTAVEAGLPPRAAAEALLAAPEFAARHGDPDGAILIATLYRNALGREPDPAGFLAWSDRLASGAVDRAALALGLSESAEVAQRMLPLTDGGIAFA